MSNTGQKVIKNAAVMMVSQVITWSMAIILTVLLPRYLGPEVSGEFGIASSIWAITAVLVSFGMDTFLVKEIARYPARAGELLVTSVVVRTGLFTLGCAGVAAYVLLKGYSPEMVLLIALIGLAQIITTLTGATEAGLQGLEVMHYSSLATILGKIVQTTLGLSVVFLQLNVYVVALALVAGGLTTLIVEAAFLRRHVRLTPRFSAASASGILRSSAPYLFASLGLTLYNQVDVLIMSSLTDVRTIGWYNAARSLFGTSFFVPVVFITAVFPLLSRTHAHDEGAVPKLLQRSFDTMLIIAVPAGIGLMIMAQPLVDILYGPSFSGSGPVLSVLGLVLTFSYLNVLIGRFLISTDRQRVWAMVMLVSAAATIPLDLLFVPWALRLFGNGAIGGAVSYLVTELGMLIFGIRQLPAGALGTSSVKLTARALVAGAAMAAVTWICRDQFAAIPIVAGALTYLAAGALLRLVPHEDRQLLAGMFRSLVARLRRRATTATAEGV
jgi:O-antigen/teichoic acid export membrane protein